MVKLTDFMDQETFDQFAMPHEEVEDRMKFVKEEMTVKIMSYKGKIFDLEPPLFVELEVTETEPGFKGNTSTGATKPCTVETGAQINVPLFVEIGDKIQIDTRTGEYLKESLIYANNESKPMLACGFDVAKSPSGACSAMSETECRHIAITSETRGACFISLLEEFM